MKARALVIAAAMSFSMVAAPAAAQAVPHPDITEERYIGPTFQTYYSNWLLDFFGFR